MKTMQEAKKENVCLCVCACCNSKQRLSGRTDKEGVTKCCIQGGNMATNKAIHK